MPIKPKELVNALTNRKKLRDRKCKCHLARKHYSTLEKKNRLVKIPAPSAVLVDFTQAYKFFTKILLKNKFLAYRFLKKTILHVKVWQKDTIPCFKKVPCFKQNILPP